MRLEGKTAIVTGGGRGLGRGIVLCLAEEGADVAIIDIDGGNAKAVADEVKSLGRGSLAIQADVIDDAQVVKVVQDVLDFFGKIDILVNNVGGSREKKILPSFIERTEEEWDDTYEANLKSHVLITRVVVPHLIKQQSGKIVNISSIAGKMAGTMVMPYAAFKAGVISFTKSLAQELGPNNINVNCICPGIIYTPLWDMRATRTVEAISEARARGEKVVGNFNVAQIEEGITPREFFLRNVVEGGRTPLRREQTPEDIGHAVVFFVSDYAINVTGQALNVDGGLCMY